MTSDLSRRVLLLGLIFSGLSVLLVQPAAAQAISQRGFVDVRETVFPEVAPNDRQRLVADGLVREEVFVKPWSWLQFAAGMDLRANSHGQVDTRRRVDLDDRTILRPAAALRRLSMTFTAKHLTV